MKKIYLAAIFSVLVFGSSAFALDLKGKAGFGVKVQGWIPMATFKLFFSERNALEIEGGFSTLGWAIQGYYVNHFAKLGSVLPYFTVGGGVNSGAFSIVTGAGLEYFPKSDLSFFAADKIAVIIAANAVGFMGGVEAGLRYYF